MSRLSDLYKAMKTLAKEGLKLSEEQEAKLRQAEEEIIQKEILPVLTEKIEPVLSQIERELVLVVDYLPGAPLRVSLSRRRNLIEELTDAVEIVPDPVVEHATGKERKNAGEPKSPKTGLRVTMPDGTIICEKMASSTLVEVIKHIGADRIRPLGLKCCKIPLISNTRDPKYSSNQHPVGGGWLALTQSSTIDKKRQLDTIARRLGLAMTVEII